jgi:hypothetical protein
MPTPQVSAKLLKSIQAKLARGAIGASSIRGAGSKGVVSAVQSRLKEVCVCGYRTQLCARLDLPLT